MNQQQAIPPKEKQDPRQALVDFFFGLIKEEVDRKNKKKA